MANLISVADGNFTDASTWVLTETGTSAEQTAITNTTNTTTSYVYSPTFTGTNANVADGILLHCLRVNTTGTVSVTLSDDNGVTATREVTVNASDLPTTASWVFFKFASTLTLDGGTDYRVGIKGSSAGNATFYRSSTTAAWSRLIRITTAPGSVAAADVTYIVGEYTAAATYASRSVTMNSTGSTNYGNVFVCPRATLSYGSSAATNYNLSLAGNLTVYENGTLNIGTSGTPIPRDSTATLDFVCASSLQYGLTVRGTFNAYGLSRTSGKDVYYALLSADYKAFNFTVSTTTEVLTLTANGCNYFSNGDTVRVRSTTTLPSPLSSATTYYVISASGNTCQLSTTLGGSAVNLTTTGSGTHTIMQETATLSVDTDTGWLSGDTIALAPTSRTYTQHESGTLSANAGASTVSVNGFAGTDGRPIYGHSGTSPTQGEVALLTRNVRIKGASASLPASVSFGATATVFMRWTEGKWLGSGASAITVASNSFDCKYCSFYSFGYLSFSGSGSGVIFSNNCMWSWSAAANSGCVTVGSVIAEISENILIGSSTLNNYCFNLAAISTKFNNNRASGASSFGILITGSGAFSEFSGNVFHSCDNIGVNVSANISPTTINTLTSYHNALYGIAFSSADPQNSLILSSPVFVGNTNYNLYFAHDSTIYPTVAIVSPTFASTAPFLTTTDVYVSNHVDMSIYGGSLSSAAGSGQNARTASTNGIVIALANKAIQVRLSGVTIDAATEVLTPSNLSSTSYIRSSKHDNTAGAFKSWFTNGLIERDTTFYKTAAPSSRMTPTSASAKLQGGSRIVAVDTSTTPTVSVWVRKSAAGDGAAYNGNQPRLIVKRNDAVGITADTVLATMTASTGSWEQLSGSISTTTADGGIEVYVDCDGTTGWINIDDWTVTT